MKPYLIIIILSISCQAISLAQPWKNPLSIATSTDGTNFTNSKVFQDSSGVPSIIHWKGDTLICAFQWFRQPVGSTSWDRVAVKYSYDNGITWTEPSPIILSNQGSFQRPFDPTLVVFAKDSIRMYFSSTAKTIPGPLDSLVNTYSAVSADGLHYTFEPNARVDVADKQVIDPAVAYFNNSWHYIAPAGAPQEGAHHYISPDGLHFSKVPLIPSDMNHNWTGNLMINEVDEMRFYGSGPNVWFNTTENGGVWKGFTNTNIKGGDPSVVKVADGSYIMIYVGQPNVTAVNEVAENDEILLYPNPASNNIKLKTELVLNAEYSIISIDGKVVKNGSLPEKNTINLTGLSNGSYLLNVKDNNGKHHYLKFIMND